MTADLVARLERCAESCDLYSPDVCGTLIEGIGHVAMRALLRKAASALRSSGEAVAAGWVFQHDETGRMTFCPNDGVNTPEVFAELNPRYALCGAAHLHPATPASAWRPIAELDHRDSRVVLFCDAQGNRWTQTADCRVPVCGLPPTLWQELPTPPTSTKGG